jgi:hypothetical protein
MSKASWKKLTDHLGHRFESTEYNNLPPPQNPQLTDMDHIIFWLPSLWRRAEGKGTRGDINVTALSQMLQYYEERYTLGV